MAYQALYRQWRPQNFSSVVGQKAIIDTLRNQVITRRIAHAYLFCGTRGTGKTSTAKILARAINCESPEDGDPCGKCPTCVRMKNDESLDIVEIDAASNNGVDEMRDLRDTVKYPPQYGRYKVYIIDEVHMLSTSAFNALLKTLEEPPEYVVFILATTEPQKLPATILSRCQRFDFGRISASDIQGRLRKAVEGAGGEATNGALMLIARAAEGGMRDALSILDMCLGYGQAVDEKLVREILGTSDKGFLFRFSSALANQDAAGVFHMIDELMRDGKEPSVFARDFSSHIRTILTAQCCGKDTENVLDLTEEDTRQYLEHAEQFTVTRLMKILEIFMGLETEMRYASSPRLALENAALKCCLRLDEPDTRAFSDRISELEKKVSDLEEKLASGVFSTFHAETNISPSQPAGKTVLERSGGLEKMKETERTSTEVKSAGAPPSSDGSNVWKSALKLLQKRDPAIHGMLNQGQFAGMRGETFLWNAPAGAQFFLKSLNSEEKKKKICDCLTEAAGMPCLFLATDGVQKESPASENEDEKYLDTLRNTLGGDHVMVVD